MMVKMPISLTLSLIRRILPIQLALTIGLTLAVTFLIYHEARTKVEENLRITARAFEDSIAVALWNYQHPLAESIAKGLVAEGQLPTGVVIDEISKHFHVRIFQPGYTSSTSDISERVDLYYKTQRGLTQKVGVMTLYTSRDAVLSHIAFAAAGVAVTGFIISAVLLVMIVYISEQDIARPLRRFCEQISLLEVDKPTELPRRSRVSMHTSEMSALHAAFERISSKVIASRTASAQLIADFEISLMKCTAELAVQNRALEQEAKMRQNVERDVARERELTQALIDAIPELLLLVDENGRIVRSNVKLERPIGSDDNTTGLHVFDIVPHANRERFLHMLNTAFETGAARWEENLTLAGAFDDPYQLAAHLVQLDGRKYVVIAEAAFSEKRVGQGINDLTEG
jgi:PAS domain-containing protein